MVSVSSILYATPGVQSGVSQGRTIGAAEQICRRPFFHGALILALGLSVLVMAGCSRAFYRQRADSDVYALVGCGSSDPRWPLEGYTIEPDRRSRKLQATAGQSDATVF